MVDMQDSANKAMHAILAARRIKAMGQAALDPACEDATEHLPVTEIIAMAEAVEDEALERLLRADVKLWKVAACIEMTEATMLELSATADSMILKRFENILPKIAELSEKLSTFKT
jgi:hypothetical protein